MNYLAHAFLSGNDPDLLIGNFIADHLRGAETARFSEPVRRGIMLHRHIDSFTDTHAAFRSAKRHFYTGYERHSGILVDIYFDHLLAADFGSWSGIPLAAFSKDVYRIYNNSRHLMPASGERFLDYLLKNDIYQSYASEAGIERVLWHLSHRIGHQVRLDQSMHLFVAARTDLHALFKTLMADLVKSFLTAPATPSSG